MTAYQWRQAAFGAAIERGLYALASCIAYDDLRYYVHGIPHHTIQAIADGRQDLPPPQIEPEQSGATGHDTTLTPRRRYGIIKSIRRKLRRKYKTEVHTMTIYGRSITNDDMCNIADYMDDAIREELHGQLAPCSNEEFLREYINRDPDILPLLQSEFDFKL